MFTVTFTALYFLLLLFCALLTLRMRRARVADGVVIGATLCFVMFFKTLYMGFMCYYWWVVITESDVDSAFVIDIVRASMLCATFVRFFNV